MLLALDVAYGSDTAAVASVCFADWPDAEPVHADAWRVDGPPADYQPGEFYKRELPYLLEAIARLTEPPDVIVIDGYVWLDAAQRPGLGARLFDALGQRIPVVGVSKTPFRADTFSERVLRGSSRTPLYVTSTGLPARQAADAVRAMHGPHRLPSLLKRVDRLCRDALDGNHSTPAVS